MLEIPFNIISALPSANLSYVVAVLSRDDYFNLDNNDFSTSIILLRDLTMLMPNSAPAVAHFNTSGKVLADIDKQLNYHILDRLLSYNPRIFPME
jgi:hypothetical protein